MTFLQRLRVLFGTPRRPRVSAPFISTVLPESTLETCPETFAPTTNAVIPDLPVEIWDEILSYLPQGNLVKMIGINRYLFEVGMNSIYRSLCLSDIGSPQEKKILQQLQRHPDLASRVQHLKMSPSFLPLYNNLGEALQPVPTRTIKLMEQLANALHNCTEVETVTINFHFFRAVTPQFQDILRIFFKDISPTLRSLTIMTSIIHIRLMEAIASCIEFPRLELINLTILPSYLAEPERRRVVYISPEEKDLRNFRIFTHRIIAAARPNLRKLSITNHDLVDMLSFFDSFGDLPPLEEIKYQCCSHPSSLSRCLPFYNFVESSQNLTHLSLTTSAKSAWSFGPPTHYQEPPLHFLRFIEGVLGLYVPSIRELHLQLPESSGWLLLRLSTFSPNLRALAIETSPLEYSFFQEFLGAVVEFSQGQTGRDRLEHLEIRRLQGFSPVHLKKTLHLLPGLKILALGFSRLVNSDYVVAPSPHHPRYPSRSPGGGVLWREFRSLKFTDLGLEELYLQIRTGEIVSRPDAPQKLIHTLSKVLPGVGIRQGFAL